MFRREQTALRKLRRMALDPSTSIVNVLRYCVAFGGDTNSVTLREWVMNELNGYPPDAELPTYRRLAAPLSMDGATPLLDEVRDGAVGIEYMYSYLLAQRAPEPLIDWQFEALFTTIDEAVRQSRFKQLFQYPLLRTAADFKF